MIGLFAGLSTAIALGQTNIDQGKAPSGPGGSQAALAQSRRAAPRSGLKKPTQGPFGQAALISKASLRPRLTHGEAFSELATRASRFGCRFPLRQRSRTRREVCRQSRGGHPVSQLQACTQVIGCSSRRVPAILLRSLGGDRGDGDGPPHSRLF